MDFTALVLTIIGALNWALVGIFQFDLVAWIFGGQGALVSRIIYTIIGLAGIWCISPRRCPVQCPRFDVPAAWFAAP